MTTRRVMALVLLAAGTAVMHPQTCDAQCCLNDFFAGLGSCCRTAPPRPVAMAPVMAQPVPIIAPVAPIVAPAAPPPPVMVPVQQVSYVPETCYKTQYECVPVTCYRPVTEVDPCTGCATQCMQQETTYVQRAVNVPYTQYRAVYSTKYVQMQPGAAGSAVAAPGATYAPVATPPAGTAVSPFAAPAQAPAAWGAAGTDVPPTLVPQQPIAPQQSFQQQIIPQSGVMPQGQTYAQQIPTQPNGGFLQGGTVQQAVPQLSPTAPPQLSPAPGPQASPSPSLRPIPEAHAPQATGSQPFTVAPPTQSPAANGSSPSVQGGSTTQQPAAGERPTLQPAPASPSTQSLMPTVPGAGPGTATGAFPRLLEPTGHTTWNRPAAYPTAALPGRLQ